MAVDCRGAWVGQAQVGGPGGAWGGTDLTIHLTESELNEKSISVLEQTMTDSEVFKHTVENKLAVMEEYGNSATKKTISITPRHSTPIMKESW